MVDRLVERAADAWLEAVAGAPELVRVEDEAAVRSAATDAGIGVADGVVASGADIGKRRAGGLTDRGVGDGATSDEGIVVASGLGITRVDGGEVEPSKGERARRPGCGVDRLGRRPGRRTHGAHGTIFSIGRTRIPEAPAALSRGRRPQTSSAPTTEWIAIIPACASGITVGDSSAGKQVLELAKSARRGVHHQVLAAARGDDGAQHRVDGGQVRGAVAVGGRVRDEDRFRREDVADLAQAVHHEGRAGRDEIDDGLGETEPWRDLDGARDRDDLDGDPALLEEPAGRVRVGGRHAKAGQVIDGLVGRVVRDGGGEPAAAVAERPDPGKLRAGLTQEVLAGDPEVGDAVSDELDDVVRPDEQDVELVVLDERDEAPIVFLEDEAGVVQQAQRGFDQPTLVRDGESKTARHRSPVTGYGVVPSRETASSLSSMAR